MGVMANVQRKQNAHSKKFNVNMRNMIFDQVDEKWFVGLKMLFRQHHRHRTVIFYIIDEFSFHMAAEMIQI